MTNEQHPITPPRTKLMYKWPDDQVPLNDPDLKYIFPATRNGQWRVPDLLFRLEACCDVIEDYISFSVAAKLRRFFRKVLEREAGH